jgi:hypothetical protein
MKKIFNLIFLYLLFQSCSKDDTSSPSTPSNTGSSYISMKINGVQWKSEVGIIAAGISAGNFVASASKKVGDKTQALSMAIESVSTSGPNAYNSNTKGGFLFLDGVNNVSFSLGNGSTGTGTLQITKTKTVVGITQASATFSGTTKDTKGNAISITEGVVHNSLAE